MARFRDEAAWDRWRRVLADHQQSGMAISEFCRQRRLNPSSFYLWRKKLSETEKHDDSPTPTFVAVSLPNTNASTHWPASPENQAACGHPSEASGNPTHFRVSLPNGIRVDVAPEFDTAALRDLLSVARTFDSGEAE